MGTPQTVSISQFRLGICITRPLNYFLNKYFQDNSDMPFEPPIITLGKILYDAIIETQSDVDSGDMVELKKEEARQEISMRMAERQAKVAQELAIAERIRDAEEVEIEEYNDNSKEGSGGLNVSESSVALGVNGKSAFVSKRVFRFKGRDEKTIELFIEKP
jgi:hypothetical protein